MTDIASLGLQVESSEVSSGTRDLERFAQSAQRATDRSRELGRVSDESSRSLAAANSIVQRATAALGGREQATQSLLRAELALARAHHARAQAEVAALRATGAASEEQMQLAVATAEATRAQLAAARAADLEATALQTAIKAQTSAGAAASELSNRFDVLSSKFTEGYNSARQMDLALDELVEAERLGVQITGGYATAIDAIVLKYDAAARASAEYRAELDRLRTTEAMAASAADAQGRFNSLTGVGRASAGSARDSASLFGAMLDEQDAATAMDAQRQFNSLLGVQDRLQNSARASASVFEAQARELEETAIAAARLRAAIDPMGALQARYNSEIAQFNMLASRGAITATELAQAHALAASRMRQSAVGQGLSKSGSVNRMHTGNIAAQFHDIGVTAAMGMNPMMIALQQGTQLSQVMNEMENPIKGLGEAFMSLINPITIFTLAAVALVAVGLQIVDWGALAKTVLDALSVSIEAIAPYAVVAAAALALFYAPALIGGLVSLIALMGRVAVSSTIMAATLAAANPAVALVLGITAVVAALNIFNEEIKRVFGRDLAADAADGINWLIGTLVGGFEGVKNTWSMLPDIMGEIGVNAANTMITSIELMINQSIAGINKLIEYARSAGIDIGSIGSVSLGRINNPNAGAANRASTLMGDSINQAQSTDYVGKFTGAIAKGASAASDALKSLATSLAGTDAASEKAAARAKKNYDEIILDAQQYIESQRLERESLGLTEEATARLRYEQELLHRAQQDGINLTPMQVTELKSWAAAMAEAEVATDRAKEALGFAKDVTRGFLGDIKSGLQEGKTLWESFGTAVMNVLDKVINKLLDELVDAMFQTNSAMSGGGGGGGGFMSIISSIFGGGSPGAPMNILPNARGGVHNSKSLSAYSNSIVTKPTMFAFARGAGLMGEAGPEAILPLQRGRGGQLGVVAGSGGGTSVQIIDQRGSGAPPVRQERGRGPDGREQLKFFILETVSEGTVRGKFDKPQRARFGSSVRRV